MIANSMYAHNSSLQRACCPTLVMMKGFTRVRMGSEAAVVESFRRLRAAGVPMLAGTDANSSPTPFAVSHGKGLHQEFELLVEAGMSELEVLRSATSVPPKYFESIGDRGVIGEGKRADLVLLSANPLANIANTRRIERVWIAGREVDRGSRQGGSKQCGIM